MKFTHRADRYAEAVHGGVIVAGPYVRLAAQRHLDDRLKASRKSGHPGGFFFHDAAADHIIDFFERVLWLADSGDEDEVNRIEGDPIPFTLTPANAFIVGSIFGWKKRNGYRRFRFAYIEMGKGNGKTPLAAGIGLYGLLMDGERAPEIYSIATGIEQARICWRDAERMVEVSPDLSDQIHTSNDNLAYAANYGWFRPISKEKRGKSGPRPHMGLFDELHEYADAVIVNKVRGGAKRRKQPLFVEITNSGFDRTSICWQHHEHAVKMLEGTAQDDRLFAYVCALDKGDQPFKDRRCWVKANPNLGVIIQEEYLEIQIQNAQNIPSEKNDVLRYNFCVWTQAKEGLFDMAKWHLCNGDVSDDELVGVPCYGGIDLGQTDDFSAWAMLWDLPDERKVLRLKFWIPSAALQKYPNRPYAEWETAGILNIQANSECTDYDLIEEEILEDCRTFNVKEVAYDKKFAQQMALHLQGADIVMVDTPQGFALNEAIQLFEEWVVNGALMHGGNIILGWMAANTVVRHGPNKTRRLDKEASKEKIDGIVAAVMTAHRVVGNALPEGESAYADGHGVIVV
jgi:phage terminase large subunit-like protein